MNTIQQMERLIGSAERLGYQIRYDYFGGTGGGICEFSGSKWLFIDLALTTFEQLELVKSALAADPLYNSITQSTAGNHSLNLPNQAA